MEEARELLRKYNKGYCTEAERAMVEHAYEIYNEYDIDISQRHIEAIGKEIKSRLPIYKNKRWPIKLWAISSSAAACFLGFFIWMFVPSEKAVINTSLVHEIKPGGQRATITLSNGQSIPLSSEKKTLIIEATRIGYDDGSSINAQDLTGIQTISTPKGGEYDIMFPDGTRVWLNSSTTLQFRANLKDKGKRVVKLLSGEAYFEVKKDRAHPFLVATGRQDVAVLGTHFNINAYSMDQIKTTLTEGSVKVTEGSKLSKILSPGEQSINTGSTISVNQVDIDIELAWKKGKIQFLRSDLKSVLAMVSRWYDVEILYQYYPKDARFTGSVSRNKNISEVLNLLETTGDVHFKIEGRRIMVMQ